MDELFGLSMNRIMLGLLAIVVPSLLAVAVMALRNRVMLKLGLRNIPRRRIQTVLIVVGIMLSSVIMAAAFGTGDTINYSIRTEGVEVLGTIDEIIFFTRATSDDSFGSNPYFPQDRFHQLKAETAVLEGTDGLAPGIGELVPAINLRTSLSGGRMRVAGVDPTSLAGFGTFKLTSGEEVRLEDLGRDEGYINDEAADELDAREGDRLRLFLEEQFEEFTVRGVVDRGGLAGDESTLIIPLARAQELFDRRGQINSLVVSNIGDELGGVDLSEEVTERLRVHFSDREVAAQLKDLLSEERVQGALSEKEDSLDGSAREGLARLRSELGREGVSDALVSLLADEDVASEVLEALDRPGFSDVEGRADTLFSDLAEFRVWDVKRFVLDVAVEISSFVTTFFITLGLFSIMVGILLIFLIFVMLTAARRSEMGMARAVGAKRVHLVQMFVFEGTAYAVVSAAVGVLLGLAISGLITVIVNRIISGFDEGFSFTWHVEPRSAVVAYCLGMVITFATVGFSAYRVSQMNIVAAIRSLPEAAVPQRAPGIRTRGMSVLRAIFRPLIVLFSSFKALIRGKFRHSLLNLGIAIVWFIIFPIWLTDIFAAVVRFAWPYLRAGWLTLTLGVLITLLGMAEDEAAGFRIGVSLMILGLGLTVRTVLLRTAMRADLRDRLAYTFIGVLMLFFWVLPFNALRKVAGELSGGIEMFFISGMFMVAAAVWTVMYNSDLILRGLTFLTGRIGKLRPVLVTAVAYPMSAKFRTGLTLAMFALVNFTLIVMSILTNVFDVSTVDQEPVTGGWDVQGFVNFRTPIEDMKLAISNSPDLDGSDFTAIGGYTMIPIEARQLGAEEQRWEGYAVRAVDDDFLERTNHHLKIMAPEYGTTAADIWLALQENPSLAVVEASVVPRRSDFGDDQAPFQLEGLFYEDDTMEPIDIEVREPRTGRVVQLTVVGVLDQLTDSFGELGFGMFVPKERIDETIPFEVPITTYRFRLAEGVDARDTARKLEAAFQEHGMETGVMEEEIKQSAAAQRAFNQMFTGFMGLGLMVGIAALGVISLRAVVERRQQIGVLRAIGYRRGMIQLSFLLESSFVALLGIAIGVVLGAIISYNIVNDVRERENIETLRFSIPWLQIGVIVAIAYVFSLATTFIPARQASRIYPAEALRYE